MECVGTRDVPSLPQCWDRPPQLRRSPAPCSSAESDSAKGFGHSRRHASVTLCPPCQASSPAVLSCHRWADFEGQSALQPGLRPAPRSHIGPILAGAIGTGAGGDACRASSGPLCHVPCHCGSRPLVPHWPSSFLQRRSLGGGGGTTQWPTPGPAGLGSTPGARNLLVLNGGGGGWGRASHFSSLSEVTGSLAFPAERQQKHAQSREEASRRHTVPPWGGEMGT